MILLKKRPHLLLKISLAVMRLLRFDVLNQRTAIRRAYGGRNYGSRHQPSLHRPYRIGVPLLGLFALITILGCKPAPAPRPADTQTTQYPPRPTTPPPPFKLFHQTNETFTLTTTPTATDTQIEALVWQLRTAAHTHTFDNLNIPQKTIDARDPMVWFHIYRGTKCAAEKYADGPPPCGASYHAAGDYTFGGGANHQWDDGVLLHHTATGEDQETQLWNPNAPYAP